MKIFYYYISMHFVYIQVLHKDPCHICTARSRQGRRSAMPPTRNFSGVSLSPPPLHHLRHAGSLVGSWSPFRSSQYVFSPSSVDEWHLKTALVIFDHFCMLVESCWILMSVRSCSTSIFRSLLTWRSLGWVQDHRVQQLQWLQRPQALVGTCFALESSNIWNRFQLAQIYI